MKVLHVLGVSDVGGAEVVILNIIRAARPDISHAAVVLSNAPGEMVERLEAQGVPWTEIRRGRMLRLDTMAVACARLRREILRVQPDIIFSNSAQGSIYARLAAVGLRPLHVVYYMAIPSRRLGIDMLETGMLLGARPDCMFAASRFVADGLRRLGAKNVTAVHHGTELPRVDEESLSRVRADLGRRGVSPDDPVVLVPGRLQPWKGQHVFIAAMAQVHARHPRAHAVLLGDALFGMNLDYRDQLRASTRGLGLESCVHFVGQQPARPWLERASIVVHSAVHRDPFPNVCIEALAAERALVTNDLSGTCEVVEHGVHALIARAGDPEDLAACIDRLLTQPKLAAELAAAGRARFLETCTLEHMVRPIEAGLDALMLERRRG